MPACNTAWEPVVKSVILLMPDSIQYVWTKYIKAAIIDFWPLEGITTNCKHNTDIITQGVRFKV